MGKTKRCLTAGYLPAAGEYAVAFARFGTDNYLHAKCCDNYLQAKCCANYLHVKCCDNYLYAKCCDNYLYAKCCGHLYILRGGKFLCSIEI